MKKTSENKKKKITVAVLTVSDRCADKKAVDRSGPKLIELIKQGVVPNAQVVETFLLPDDKMMIESKLKEWCDSKKIDVILTTGGTGLSKRDVTPEATLSVVDKVIPGIPNLIFKHSSEITTLAALSRGASGIRNETLIINFPGSPKAVKECLESIAKIIPHAVDLVREEKKKIEEVHSELLQRETSLVTVGNAAVRPRESCFLLKKVMDAQELIFAETSLYKKEKVMLSENALGFVLASPVIASDSLPPFDASLKDGYAVRSQDEEYELKVVGVFNAGEWSDSKEPLKKGCCVRISTGAPIPEGADAVVQVEDTTLQSCSEDGSEETVIRLKKLPLKGLDIRPKGSDFQADTEILKQNTYLGSAALGVLASAGVPSVRVYEKPTVAIFSTGDELVDPNADLLPGKVRDSNRITLINICREEGFPTEDMGIVSDNPDSLFTTLKKGFKAADVVVSTGSMSMGERDYLKEVLVKDFKAVIHFGRVFMKPGKPTGFATLIYKDEKKLWFGLPGNPASAFVTAQLFLLPALRNMSSYSKVFPTAYEVEYIPECFEDRPQYVRGFISYDISKNRFVVNNTTGNQSSSRIASCVGTNCLIEIPSVSAIAEINYDPASSSFVKNTNSKVIKTKALYITDKFF